MSNALDHIDGWEAAGVIDRATADRLRAADADLASGSHEPEDVRPTDPTRSAASRTFGPSVSVAEVFTYLGAGFVLAAWSAFSARTAGTGGDPGIVLGITSLLAAGVLVAIGRLLDRRDERASRGAGVAYLLAVAYVGGAAAAFGEAAGVVWPLLGVVGAAAAVLAAVGVRVIHPSVLTQVALLASLTAMAGSFLAWLEALLFADEFSATGVPSVGPDPVLLVVASAAWWLLLALGIGLLGLLEARRGDEADDLAASRRAAVSRFWAGIVAVLGLASALTRSAALPDGGYGRVVEPWIASVALLVVSGVLVERAFRRDATSYIYAAALGLILALTDFNLTYLSDSTEVALLIEGLILLAVGVAADRLRRRLGRDKADGPDGPEEPFIADDRVKSTDVPAGASPAGEGC